MQSDDINDLVKLARQGNAPALAELVAVVQRDLRVFIAAYAASHEMAEAVFAEVWQFGQRDIVETQDMTGWLAEDGAAGQPLAGLIDRLRAYARDQLRDRLATCMRQAMEAQDTLLHVVARTAAETLANAGTTPPMIAAPVAERMKRMPPAATGLLEKRYRERLGLAVIGTGQGRSSDEVAGALCTARATVDWQCDGQLRIDPGDRRFPIQVEEFIAGTIAFDVRNQLGESLMADLGRASAFERQVRLDLVLTALLRRETRQAVAAAVAQLMPVLTAPPAAAAPVISRASTPPRTPSDQLRLARIKPPGKSAAPLWIVGGALAAAAVVVAVMFVNRATATLPPANPSPTLVSQLSTAHDQSPTAVEAAGLGQVRRVEGVAYLRQDGKLFAAQPGALLRSGQGIETSGAGSQVTFALNDRGEAALSGDAVVLIGDDGSSGCTLALARGKLRVEGSAGGHPLQITCERANLDAAAAAFSLGVGNGEFTVVVERGSVALSRAGDTAPTTVEGGNHATIDVHGTLSVDSGGRWVRGIALGGS